MNNNRRCGVIAIIGEPNAGKSTLLNQLTGSKISIITPKEQTTRANVRGVCIEDDAQMIFIDTPGIFGAEAKFEQAMVRAAWAGARDADAVLLLIDAKKGLRNRTQSILTGIRELAEKGKSVFLALNKVDTVAKPVLLELVTAITQEASQCFREVFMISALSGDGVTGMRKALAATMPQGPWHYPTDHLSDIPMRLLAAEITREKIFLMLNQEMPYSAFVETEMWEETQKNLKISQVIYVEREGQKKIMIGEKGAMIKRIGSSARRELEEMLERKLHLELHVKVRPWKNAPDTYRMLGLTL